MRWEGKGGEEREERGGEGRGGEGRGGEGRGGEGKGEKRRGEGKGGERTFQGMPVDPRLRAKVKVEMNVKWSELLQHSCPLQLEHAHRVDHSPLKVVPLPVAGSDLPTLLWAVTVTVYCVP